MVLEDIEKRQAILAAIVDSSDDAIISKDLNSIITSWNKGAEKMFGYTEAEAIGRNINILIPPNRLPEEDMIISNLRQGKKIDHFETVRVHKSGRELIISLTVSPIKDTKGRVIGASKIARDITRQKEQEEIIKQYYSRLESISQVGRGIFAELNVESILQKVTDAATRLSGASFGAFFFNKIDSKGDSYMLYTLSGAPREAFEKFGMPRNTEVFRMTFEGKGILRSDDITKDPRYGKNSPHHGMPKGHLPVVSYLAVPIYSKNKLVIGGLFLGHPSPGVFKKEHEHLVEAIATHASIAIDNASLYEEVQALNKKKDDFIGFASHELKTPLSTLGGYIELAKEMPEVAVSFLDKMQKQVVRLNNIISDLLNISKIQAGKLDIHYSPATLGKLIRDTLELLNLENNQVEVSLPNEEIAIVIDFQKISQVLINLVSNAVKYSSAGSVIRIEGLVLGDQIQISVADQGIGISANHLEKIFHQFFRVEQDANVQGIGLGLYIAREIVEAHSGKIWAESEQGKGSTFYVMLPIQPK